MLKAQKGFNTPNNFTGPELGDINLWKSLQGTWLFFLWLWWKMQNSEIVSAEITLSLHFTLEWRLNYLLWSCRRCYPAPDIWPGTAPWEPGTKTFCPKHSLCRGKGEFGNKYCASAMTLYKERSLSVLWCKCDKGRKEVWTWKKVPTVSSCCCKTLTTA